MRYLSLSLVLALGCADSSSRNIAPLDHPPRSTAPVAPLMPAAPAEPVAAQAMGLALTPPMGFNDWNAFGCNVSEALIRETADFFVSSGLKAAGYQYVNIDDCWALRERGADGKLVPDPAKFPSGIAGVAEYVHGLGLKLGIYGDAGTLTCAGYPGSLNHEDVDAQTFADWGVDYLKYDNCSNQSDGSRADFVRRYTAMRTALDETQRAIVYSICEWGQSQPWEWATSVGQLWRTTGDIGDNWASLRSIIAANADLAEYAGPGHWNDPDMLEIGNGGMTTAEYRTHMSLWAMMAAPLIIGTDLRRASADTLAILSNQELIALDQDPLGKQASVLSNSDGLMVFEKPLTGGERAIALYNSTDSLALIRVPAASTGLGAAAAYRLHDVWSGSDTQAATTLAAGVPAHGTVVLRTSPLSDATALAPSVSVSGSLTTLIAGSSESATLTGITENHGVGAVTDLALSIEAPAGWVVAAANGSSGGDLASDGSLASTWSVQVPQGTRAGTYPVSVVASYAWGSDRQAASTRGELSVTVVVPPPDGTSPISLLVPLSSSNGAGPVERDMSVGSPSVADGNLITLNGTVYTRGLGTNAASKLTYYLGGRCSSLTTDVGIDDEVAAGGSATFRIYADERVVAESPSLTAADAAQTLTADLTGAHLLVLETDPGDATEGDHADWAAPRIVCGSSTEPTTHDQTLFSFETGTEDWTLSNVATGGSIAPSASFHTEGAQGLQITSPGDGNWFGRVLAAPLDLSGKTLLAFDLKTGEIGTSGEFAVQVGAGATAAWCQGGKWVWTNPNSSRTIKTAFSEMTCPAGTSMDLKQISAVWVFVKGGTFTIDQVRAE